MTVVASRVQPTRFAASSQYTIYFAKGTPFEMSNRRMSSANEGMYAPTALILRKLPLSTTAESVRTMLLFAKDLQNTEVVPNECEEDNGFATAIARFSSMTGASEAQAMLDGKPNTAGRATMVVEMLPSPSFSAGFRRNTIDPALARPLSQATSPTGRSARYNGGFDSMNNMSPPPATSPPEGLMSDGSGTFSSMYQQRSPRSSELNDRMRISGKSVIDEDGGDDETDGLLQDPVGYARRDNSHRLNGRQGLSGAFGSLSLSTTMSGPQHAMYHTPRSAVAMPSPHTPFSPGPGSHMAGSRYHGVQFPPVNPADQNPPCNTLYVGNLPMDTSEDELKAMFSKQRGYKRLCFRTKQNGPMCFVEFEDISFATKALNELYGAQLHNSVKGGIRLSFSKNPLGVRSGQAGGSTGPSTPLGPPSANMVNGMSAMSLGAFSTANGPPPGLSVPSSFPPSTPGTHGQYTRFGMRSPPAGSGLEGSMGSMYPDYMMGR